MIKKQTLDYITKLASGIMCNNFFFLWNLGLAKLQDLDRLGNWKKETIAYIGTQGNDITALPKRKAPHSLSLSLSIYIYIYICPTPCVKLGNNFLM